MTLTIGEYANGYVDADILDGDIDYREQEAFLHRFDTLLEAVEWAVDNIHGEMSTYPCSVEDFAANGLIWISANDQEFRHGCSMPDGLGGTWYTDRSWHFGRLTRDERLHIGRALAVNRNVYRLETWVTNDTDALNDEWLYDRFYSTTLTTKTRALEYLAGVRHDTEASRLIEISPWGAMDACSDGAGGCEHLMASGPDGHDWWTSIIATEGNRIHFAAFVFDMTEFVSCTWGSIAVFESDAEQARRAAADGEGPYRLAEDAPEHYIEFLRMAWGEMEIDQ